MTKHSYTFGTQRNGYFNGSDGTITRDDGKTIKIRHDDRCLSVCVKDYEFGLKADADEDVKRMARELPERYDHDYGSYRSADEALYDDVREGWWRNDVEWLINEDEDAPTWATGYHSAGRSGGWCVIEGTEWLAEHFYSTSTFTEEIGERCYIDEDEFKEAIEQRDEFCELAFSIVESIDGAHEYLIERIREEYDELEAQREANEIRGEN